MSKLTYHYCAAQNCRVRLYDRYELYCQHHEAKVKFDTMHGTNTMYGTSTRDEDKKPMKKKSRWFVLRGKLKHWLRSIPWRVRRALGRLDESDIGG